MDGAQVHGNTNLELAWTVAPVLILVAIGSFIFYKLPGIEDVPAADRVEVTVEGHQYYWNFIYPNGVIAVDRLRAPVGQTTRLEVTAPDYGVIHSWWIPALGGKFDAIPGRVNETWFSAEAPGIYRGQCAELCGGQHALMTAEVEAMPPRRVQRVARARSPRAGGGDVRTSAPRRSAAPAGSATGSPARATSGRRWPATRCSTTRRRSSRWSATGATRCRRSARAGTSAR